ncbi:hypothetical protein J3R83DRAFT_2603, partial [Lanmaoa asiatica]
VNIAPFLGISYGFGMHGAMLLVLLWMSNDTLQNFLVKHDSNLGVVYRLQFVRPFNIYYLLNNCRHLFRLSVRQNKVFLDADYTARLVGDFGYASLVGNIPETLTYLRRSTTRLVTLRWIAPFSKTHLTGQPRMIYSFGCVGLQGGPWDVKSRFVLIFLHVLSGKQSWHEVQEDADLVLRLAHGHKAGRPESRPVDDLHWDLIQRCWSSGATCCGGIITSTQRFLGWYP